MAYETCLETTQLGSTPTAAHVGSTIGFSGDTLLVAPIQPSSSDCSNKYHIPVYFTHCKDTHLTGHATRVSRSRSWTCFGLGPPHQTFASSPLDSNVQGSTYLGDLYLRVNSQICCSDSTSCWCSSCSGIYKWLDILTGPARGYTLASGYASIFTPYLFGGSISGISSPPIAAAMTPPVDILVLWTTWQLIGSCSSLHFSFWVCLGLYSRFTLWTPIWYISSMDSDTGSLYNMTCDAFCWRFWSLEHFDRWFTL